MTNRYHNSSRSYPINSLVQIANYFENFKPEEKFENKHELIDKSSMFPLHAHLSTLNHQNMTIFKKAWYRLQETLLIIKYDVYIHNNIYDIHNLMNIHNDY